MLKRWCMPNARAQRSRGLVVALALLLALLPSAVAAVGPEKRPARANNALLQMARERPNDTVRVIVQKKHLAQGLQAKVQGRGGRILKEVPMIEGMVVELPARAVEALSREAGVHWITLDAPLRSSAVLTSTVSDYFASKKFDGNDGSQNWSGPWQELGEADGPKAGNVQVGNFLCVAGSCLRLGGTSVYLNGLGASRQADLSDAASAQLNFSYRRGVAFSMTGSASVQVSKDGGTRWATLATYALNANDANPVSQSLDITAFIAPNTQVRFISTANSGRTISFDNIQIEYATALNLPTAPGSSTVRDAFSSVSYAGNDGSVNWSSNWIESDAGGSSPARAGNLRAVSDNRCAGAGGNCLQMNLRSVGDNVYRTANLAGATAAMLTLWRNNQMLSEDNDDAVALEVSPDGNAWTTLRTWRDVTADLGAANETFDLTPYASAATRIRVRVLTNIDGGYFYLDNVQIEYTMLANAYARSIGAEKLWKKPPYLDGQGIGVAVVDSGVGGVADLLGAGSSRVIASVVTNNSVSDANDQNGHGTHVAGIIGGNGATSSGARIGIAPGVNLVNVRVSDSQGCSYVSDLVEGLQWIREHKDAYNIRVVNISLNSTVAEAYDVSPLDAAVEILWFDGIVVVVAAGNNGNGSTPVTLYPPANDPYVITVGAVDDAGTATLADDALTAFSAFGVTESHYAKPELVAPGRNIISLLASTSARLYIERPDNRVDANLFRLSGTSMAAPMVSGAVALLLQDEPNLNPNQVKYRLMATANKNWAGYSAAKTGAGYLDVYAAVRGTSVQAGNQGARPHMLLARMALIAYWASNQGRVVDWGSVNWDSVNWDSVNWDSVNWDSVNWDSVNWDSVNWDSVNWDSVNWDSVNWDSVNWDSVNWDSVNWDSVNWDSMGGDSGMGGE